jgi:hypothetical protein
MAANPVPRPEDVTDISTGVSSNHSRTVAYPSGHVVAFPDIPGYAQRSKTAISHPLDSIKAVAGTLAKPSDPALLDAAHQAWSEGNHVEAATHIANYMLPFIGKGNEQVMQDLKDKNYARALGHVALSAPLSQVEKIRNKPEPSRFSAATQAAKKLYLKHKRYLRSRRNYANYW